MSRPPTPPEPADLRRFSAVIETLDGGVLVQDHHGRVLDANATACRLLGMDRADLVTDPPSPLDWQARYETSVARDETPGRRAIAEGQSMLGRLVRVTVRGVDQWFEISSVPIRLDDEGELLVISSFRDVTDRVEADEAIRFQALLLDTAGQAIIAIDDTERVLYWNRHAEQMYGWTKEEAIGRSITELVRPVLSAQDGEAIVERILGGGSWSGDHTVRRRDDHEFQVFATITPVLDDRGKQVASITVATDVTDRRKAEDQTRRLSAIVDSSSDAIIGMDPDRTITSWNRGAATLFGYDEDEAIGRHASMLAPSLDHDQDLHRRVTAEGLSVSELEVPCRTKSGAIVQVSLSLSPIFDADGAPVGVSAIGRDISQRIELERQAEASRLEAVAARRATELEAARRSAATRSNEAKSEFLSRMSHELRTPLNAVLGFAQILQLDDLSDKQRANVTFIQSAGEHLLALINDVLDVSGIEAGTLRLSLEPVDLDEVVGKALALIRPLAAQRGIVITAGDEPTGVAVLADRHRLLQILINLLSNAVKYNRPDGTIALACRHDDDTVSIAVSDTGFGIPDADLGRLFTPFDRLGAESTDVEGTGVGLALSRLLSQQMGGALTATSTVGTGSTFVVQLPASQR